MQLDFATFMRVAHHVLQNKNPLMLRGRHGIGKSELVYQTAKKMDLKVVERRSSQMTEGDLIGLPSIVKNSTAWNPPDWFKLACNEPVMLFLDELDRAVIEVRQGIFELADSRKLNGHHLHPDTIIVAACNGGVDSAQYQVGEMDPAELDRWTVFDVSPTVEDWLNFYAKENVHVMVYDFINLNRDHLEHKGDFEPNKKYPSRRSWKRCSDALSLAGMFEEGKTSDIRNIAVGYIGYEGAIAFHDFVEKYDRQVNPEDVLIEGKIEKTEKFGIIEHCALIDKMESKGLIKNVLPKEQVENLVRYFCSLPSEAAMKLWHTLGKGASENTIALHQTKVGKLSASAYMKEIFTGKHGAIPVPK